MISWRVTANRVRMRIAVSVVVVVVLIVVASKIFSFTPEITIPGYDRINQHDYPELGIAGPEQFPPGGESRIPKIIHQTWKDTDIPHQYVEWMKSWTKNHPGWTYMFWTDESARQLISDRHPDLLTSYDGYLENIRRADAMRYVILYEYGGVYADLDMESLQPLDAIFRKYTCILPQEPYEHPIIDGNFEHLVINAFMACRAKHPMMRRFMENLPAFAHMWNVLDSTGPHYVTYLYRQYVKETEKPATDQDGVYLAPAEYFLPTIDPVKFGYMKDRCFKFETLSKIQKNGCIELKRKGLERTPYPYSFTVHHWMHTYFVSRHFLRGPVSIYEIISQVKIYNHS